MIQSPIHDNINKFDLLVTDFLRLTSLLNSLNSNNSNSNLFYINLKDIDLRIDYIKIKLL